MTDDARQTGDTAPQRPMRRRVFVASLIGLMMFMIVTVAVTTNSALQGRIGPAGLLALVIFAGVALVASLATTEVIPWGARDIRHWLQYKVMGAVAGALVVAASAVFSILSLLVQPGSPAPEQTAQRMSRIVQHIAGSGGTGRIWGERGLDGAPDCAISYRLTLSPAALVMQQLPSDAVTGTVRYEFSRIRDNDVASANDVPASEMRLVQVGGRDHNKAVSFVLTDNGVSQELSWFPASGTRVDLVDCAGRQEA